MHNRLTQKLILTLFIGIICNIYASEKTEEESLEQTALRHQVWVHDFSATQSGHFLNLLEGLTENLLSKTDPKRAKRKFAGEIAGIDMEDVRSGKVEHTFVEYEDSIDLTQRINCFEVLFKTGVTHAWFVLDIMYHSGLYNGLQGDGMPLAHKGLIPRVDEARLELIMKHCIQAYNAPAIEAWLNAQNNPQEEKGTARLCLEKVVSVLPFFGTKPPNENDVKRVRAKAVEHYLTLFNGMPTEDSKRK